MLDASEKKRGRPPAKRASASAAMHRAMREQSLTVPWRDLADSSGELIVWLSFGLWVRAVISAERELPDWLRQQIDQRCPGFLDGREKSSDPESIWVDLSSWVDEHFFRPARDGGWLDALHYYCGRDPRSDQVWDHWTRTESAWRHCPPTPYPSFDEWHRQTLGNRTSADGVTPTADDPAALVREYIEWEAFVFWARLVVETAGEVPAHLVSVLDQRYPGFTDQLTGNNVERSGVSTWLWQELLAWIESHFFAEAKSDLDAVRAAARNHLRGERIAAYWAHCSSRWSQAPPNHYPSFEEWLRDADAFVTR